MLERMANLGKDRLAGAKQAAGKGVVESEALSEVWQGLKRLRKKA